MTELNKDGLIPGSIVSDEDYKRIMLDSRRKKPEEPQEKPKEVKRRGRPKTKAD